MDCQGIGKIVDFVQKHRVGSSFLNDGFQLLQMTNLHFILKTVNASLANN